MNNNYEEKEHLKELHDLLAEDIPKLDKVILEVYTDILNYYNENKEEVPEYIARELSKIIHLIEVTEDYTEAFKRINILNMEVSPLTCKHSYIKRGV